MEKVARAAPSYPMPVPSSRPGGEEFYRVYDVENRHQSIDAWLSNIFQKRERLKAIASPQFYNDFRAYLKAVRYVVTDTELMQLHIIGSRKMDPTQPVV